MGRGSPCRVRVASGGSRRKASSMTARARCHNRKTRSAAWENVGAAYAAFLLSGSLISASGSDPTSAADTDRSQFGTRSAGLDEPSTGAVCRLLSAMLCNASHGNATATLICETNTIERTAPVNILLASRIIGKGPEGLTHGHDLILLRLLLRGDRNDEAICYPLFGLDALDNAVTQRPETRPRSPAHQTKLCQSDGGWQSAVALELGTAKRISSATVERVGAAPPSRAAQENPQVERGDEPRLISSRGVKGLRP